MKLLRQIIREILLEGPVKDEFEEEWYTEVDYSENTYKNHQSEMGTFHRDAFTDGYRYSDEFTEEEKDQLFDAKRSLKRMWNETIDANNLRKFWEGPKMKYFHSLSYYGGAQNAVDSLQQGEYSDSDIRDLSISAFLREYKLKNNKDEMSTWGYHVPSGIIKCPKNQMTLGVLLKGRVTMVSAEDAWTESRSKASKKDKQRHKGSGDPKRMVPTNSNVNNLLFEEVDILDRKAIGECIIDNWGIEAIVYNPKNAEGIKLEGALEKISEEYGIPVVTAQDAFGIS